MEELNKDGIMSRRLLQIKPSSERKKKKKKKKGKRGGKEETGGGRRILALVMSRTWDDAFAFVKRCPNPIPDKRKEKGEGGEEEGKEI